MRWVLGALKALVVFAAVGAIVATAAGWVWSRFNLHQTDRLPDPHLRVTAATLLQEAGANQVAAEAKYHGEWVAITGTILDFATGLSGGPALELGATAAPSLAIVWCEFPKDAVSQVASLSKGRRAELICLGDIFTMAPHFRECRLVGSLPPEKVCEPGAKHKIKETMSQAPGRAFLASDRSFAEAMLGFIKEQDVMSAGKLALSDAYFTVPAESEVTVLSSAPQGLCEVRTGIPWRKGWVTEFQLRF